MRKRFILTFKIILLLLILPLLGIAFAPPAKINAVCDDTTNPVGSIKVSNGLISANDLGNINPQTGVNCITGQQATIPQFSIPSYEKMKKDYYDQAKSNYVKPPLPTGNQTQNTSSTPINLVSQ